MFGECHYDSVVQRSIGEALACQDMLERTPVTPSALAQARAWIAAAVRWLTSHHPVSEPQVTPPVRNGTLPR
jgi:hypothetical protein